MIEIFKNWISSMLCIGIFITFVQLIIPKTNLRKYIYSLIGIVTVLTVVSPVIDFMKNETVENSVSQVIASISDTGEENSVDIEKYKNSKEEAVKQGFIDGIKRDIKTKLSLKGIVVKNVEIFLTEEYDIEKVQVNISKINQSASTMDSVNNVVNYINSEYDIEFSKIVVIEEGI